MLGIFALAAVIGLALLVYFWPPAATHNAFDFTRSCIIVAVLTFAGGNVFAQLAAMDGNKELLSFAILAEAAGWVAIALTIKGIFMMLHTRSLQRASKQASSSP